MSTFFEDTMQGLYEAVEISKSDIPWRNLVDGRLTESSDGMHYDWRELIAARERLGRPLTEDELAVYKIE